MKLHIAFSANELSCQKRLQLSIASAYVTGGDGLIGVGATYPVPGTSAAAANTADHTWLQFDPQIVWTAGAIAVNQVIAIPGIDHGPIPMENLEFIVWGANSATPGSWEEGKIVSIYRDGFDTANTEVGHSDDYASRWQFTQGIHSFA